MFETEHVAHSYSHLLTNQCASGKYLCTLQTNVCLILHADAV